MSFTKIFYGGASAPDPVNGHINYYGRIYAITFDGRLIWHQDTDRHGQNKSDGSTGWAPGSGKQIGIGWNNFKHVFSGGDGIIYAIKPGGELLWYKDTDLKGNNGPKAERGWAPGSGNQIGFGWDNFKHVFSGGDGVIYAVTPDGKLLWYRDFNRRGGNAPDGSSGWSAGSGNQIHFGWNRFIHICAVGGTIYAVTDTGRLLWFQDDDRQGQNDPGGSTGWAPNSGKQIGVGWNGFSHVISGGSEPATIGEQGGNILYAVAKTIPSIGVRATGKLLWYRDFNRRGGNAPDGSSGWSAGSGNQIDKGW
jgi:Tachylectin/PQQ-like domain